jgi:hypothetical protein
MIDRITLEGQLKIIILMPRKNMFQDDMFIFKIYLASNERNSKMELCAFISIWYQHISFWTNNFQSIKIYTRVSPVAPGEHMVPGPYHICIGNHTKTAW